MEEYEDELDDEGSTLFFEEGEDVTKLKLTFFVGAGGVAELELGVTQLELGFEQLELGVTQSPLQTSLFFKGK